MGVGQRRVVIAGAGIGGLVAGIALRRAGWEVSVLERVPELRPVGAGLTVQPNALVALSRIDLGQAVSGAGARVTRARLVDWSGRDISSVRLDEAAESTGFVPVAIHRSTLHEVLLDALGRDALRLGAEVTGFQDDGTVRVTLAGGEEVAGDVLVGADGIHSTVRAGLLGVSSPRYSGYTCWRGVVAREDRWPADHAAEVWGSGRRIGIAPIDGDRLYWFAVVNALQGGTEADPRAAALDVVRDCAEPFRSLVADTPAGAVRRDDIIDRPPSDTWGRGRVTLLGDAAHAMTPNMGQGACQAIEDAVVLGHFLGNSADPVAALRSYEARRRPRTRWFVETSWRFGAAAQWESGPLRFLRDAGMRLVPHALTSRSLRRAWTFELPEALDTA